MASFDTVSDGILRLEDVDDGHIPGGGCSSSSASTSINGTKLAINLSKAHTKFVTVFDELVEATWSQRAYEYALDKKHPWGVYILNSEALDSHLDVETLYQSGDKERAIALRYLRALVYERGASLVAADFPRIHGTVVWCLQSGVTNSVEYHIDYAELYRYETNIIHPPLYAGTAHVSPPTVVMKGGHFMVNTDGLDHYRKFGYKGRKRPGDLLLDIENNDGGSWLQVPYHSNRGILHDGDLPHLSTPVENILPATDRRVILGFNCFTDEVGPCCARAPEHSDAFNRTVRLYQTLASAQAGNSESIGKYANTSDSTSNGTVSTKKSPSVITVQDIKKNPALAKLLVAAAKRVKEAALDKG